MAYDEDFDHRVRERLANEDAITEKAMFGGLAFLLNGNMAVGISSGDGGLVAFDSPLRCVSLQMCERVGMGLVASDARTA